MRHKVTKLLAFGVGVLTTIVALLGAAAPAQAQAKKPNILFIMVDEMPFDVMGCAGHATVQTPHLDALARSGVRFDRAYTAAPICSPARWSIFTGRYAHVHGVIDNKSIADDGEILSRGPNTMRGYFGRPEESAEVIGADGWFHTGDVGHLDADGFLVITDRKKELIVSAYGKNIAPAPIENALRSSPFLSQAVVVGDRRQFLAALLVPDFDYLAGWAKERGLPQERRLIWFA